MNLQLLSTCVENLNFEKLDCPEKVDSQFNLHYGNAFAEEVTNTFQVFFELEIGVQQEGKFPDDENEFVTHKMQIRYVALFAADEDMTDQFRQSTFPKVNAPAIAYPFLRSFIGTFLLNAGYAPILLPSFNFSEAAKNKDC